jgi:hypothetical protein
MVLVVYSDRRTLERIDDGGKAVARQRAKRTPTVPLRVDTDPATADLFDKLTDEYGTQRRAFEAVLQHYVRNPPATPVLNPVPTFDVVKKLNDSGLSMAATAQELNGKGFRTATGRPWTKDSVYNLLKRSRR